MTRLAVISFVALLVVIALPISSVEAQNCMALDLAIRAQLEPWLAKGRGLFENPFASRFEWCFITSRKDWTGDGVPDVFLFRALRSFDRRADVWVTAWLPLRGNTAPLVTEFAFDELLSEVSYKGFLWNPAHSGWAAFYSDTIRRGFAGRLFEPDMRSDPDQRAIEWLVQNFGISRERAGKVLPEHLWRFDGRSWTFIIRYPP